MDLDDVVIVSALRTAIGGYGGQFRDLTAVPLGVPVMTEAIKRTGIDPAVIDDVGWGCCYQRARNEVNVARVTAIKSGVPVEVPAFTVMRVCTSSLWAMAEGFMAIRQGYNSVFLTGGVESMSTVPYTIDSLRWGARMNDVVVRDMMWDGVTSIGVGPAMGITAENLAEKYDISREAQDELAYQSHMKAAAAIKEGRFKEEIVPVEVPGARGKSIIADTDEHPRPDTNQEALARLKPTFKKDGTVTAGNASGINDGAAAVLLMSAEKAADLGLEPIVKIKAFASAGLDPAYMGLGPVPAIRKVLKSTGMSLDDINMIELNEAFASQAIGCMRELGIETSRPNELGSGISLGHPIGCTGARQMVSGMNLMKRKDYQTGLISMCIGGGMGMAMIIER